MQWDVLCKSAQSITELLTQCDSVLCATTVFLPIIQMEYTDLGVTLFGETDLTWTKTDLRSTFCYNVTWGDLE